MGDQRKIKRVYVLVAACAVVVIAAAISATLVQAFQDSSEPAVSVDKVASDLKERLAGPDLLAGSATIDIRKGTDPVGLIRTSPLVVVASPVDAAVIERPVEIDASKVDWPTPVPGVDPKAGPSTGILEYGFYSTRYSFRVEETIKGILPSSTGMIDLLTMGATVQGTEISYDGLPVYRIGERYLLFLFPNTTRRSSGDFYAGSGAYGSFLLLDGGTYQALGAQGEWIPADGWDEAELVSLLRSEAAKLAQEE